MAGDLSLPLVSLLSNSFCCTAAPLCLHGELKVGALGDGVHGAGHLVEATVGVLGHVDVIVGGPAAALAVGLASVVMAWMVQTTLQRLQATQHSSPDG